MSDTRLNIQSIKIGDLDTSVSIYTATTTEDQISGQVVATFAKLADVWARVEYMTGDEAENINAVVQSEKLIFSIWYRSDVGVTHKVLYNGNYYDIEFMEVVGRRVFLKLHGKLLRA
jgi:SPP1 family predicted phage head-tail adaptor